MKDTTVQCILCLLGESSQTTCIYAVCCAVLSRVQLCSPLDCGPPGSSVHGILQARVLEWVAMPSSRGSSPPRDRTSVSYIAGGFFTIWATREAYVYNTAGVISNLEQKVDDFFHLPRTSILMDSIKWLFNSGYHYLSPFLLWFCVSVKVGVLITWQDYWVVTVESLSFSTCTDICHDAFISPDPRPRVLVG